MIPNHHPSDDMLLRYAAGELDAPWELALSVHLTACPACRRTAAAFEEAGGAMLGEAAPAPLTASPGPDALIARAEAGGDAGAPAAPDRAPDGAEAPAEGAPVFPRALRALAGPPEAVRWSPIGGGVRQKILMQRGGTIARLLHIAPGVAVAAHGHRGPEATAVLAGGYYDGDQAFSYGDIQIVDHETPHRPVAMTDRACICLAVTDAPLRFQDWIPRLVQRFARI